MSLPDPSKPDEAIPWIRDNLRDGWTPNSDAVRTLLAEYDRMRKIEAAVRDLFEVMPMAARLYLAEHHGEVNRVWLALDLTLSPEVEG